MDNKAYLDSIAVKGASNKKEPILSAGMIKFIITGLIAFIVILIVGAMLSSGNSKLTDNYAKLYTRVNTLSDSNGPLATYQDKIKSSTLRAYNSTLQGSLSSTNTQLENLMSALKVDTTNIKSSILTDEADITTEYTNSLDEAYLVGNFDRVYASETLYQIQILLALENDIRTQTDNNSLATVLDQSINDLTILETNYKNFIAK